mmetsp:Transcript_15740/g.29894  ORF Transcript_15740/g.29894 Transcript_15740/m.29894 type:complete len:233 (-) Transcript_15740:33-731(-)
MRGPTDIGTTGAGWKQCHCRLLPLPSRESPPALRIFPVDHWRLRGIPRSRRRGVSRSAEQLDIFVWKLLFSHRNERGNTGRLPAECEPDPEPDSEPGPEPGPEPEPEPERLFLASFPSSVPARAAALSSPFPFPEGESSSLGSTPAQLSIALMRPIYFRKEWRKSTSFFFLRAAVGLPVEFLLRSLRSKANQTEKPFAVLLSSKATFPAAETHLGIRYFTSRGGTRVGGACP